MYVGDVLSALRNNRHLTQYEVAEKLGIKRARYNSWEGNMSNPPLEILVQLADFYKVTVGYLLGIEDNNKLSGIPLLKSILEEHELLIQQNIQSHVQHPVSNKQADFAFSTKDDSMINTGIDAEDIIFLRKSLSPEYNGQIIAAYIPERKQGILKRIKFNEKAFTYQLLSENSTYDILEFKPNKVQIYGVYVGHFKPGKIEN